MAEAADTAHSTADTVEAGADGEEPTVSEDPAEQLQRAMDEKDRGADHYKSGRYAEARDSWLLAMREMPKGENAPGLTRLELSLHLNLAQVFLQLQSEKDYIEAIAHASEALKIEPESSKAIYRRGVAWAGLGKFREAAGDLQKAARIEPRSAEIRKKYEEFKKKALAPEDADEELPPPVHDLASLPRAFISVAIGDEPPVRMVFALFTDTAPKTAENFRQLCTGEHEGTTARGKKFCYRGSILHRMIPGLMVQGGDFENANGTGGESIYGRRFEDEAFRDKHVRRGLLGMANDGPNTNGSNFFILFQPWEHLDRKHVIFGELVEGAELLDKLEQLPTNAECRPLTDCVIVDCGVV